MNIDESEIIEDSEGEDEMLRLAPKSTADVSKISDWNPSHGKEDSTINSADFTRTPGNDTSILSWGPDKGTLNSDISAAAATGASGSRAISYFPPFPTSSNTTPTIAAPLDDILELTTDDEDELSLFPKAKPNAKAKGKGRDVDQMPSVGEPKTKTKPKSKLSTATTDLNAFATETQLEPRPKAKAKPKPKPKKAPTITAEDSSSRSFLPPPPPALHNLSASVSEDIPPIAFIDNTGNGRESPLTDEELFGRQDDELDFTSAPSSTPGQFFAPPSSSMPSPPPPRPPPERPTMEVVLPLRTIPASATELVKTRKRKSLAVVDIDSEHSEGEFAPSPVKRKKSAKAKAAEEQGAYSDFDDLPPPPPARKKGKGKAKVVDDDEAMDYTDAPAPKKKRVKATKKSSKKKDVETPVVIPEEEDELDLLTPGGEPSRSIVVSSGIRPQSPHNEDDDPMPSKKSKKAKSKARVVSDDEDEQEKGPPLELPDESEPDEPIPPAKENVRPPPKPIARPPATPISRPIDDTPTSLTSQYSIAPRRRSLPMSELIARANARPSSGIQSPAPRSGSSSSTASPAVLGVARRSTIGGGGLTYSPYLKNSRSALSRIAPLHPNRRTPPPPMPPPPPKKKSKKELEMEERWEEEMIDEIGGTAVWVSMGEDERKDLRRAKFARERGDWED